MTLTLNRPYAAGHPSFIYSKWTPDVSYYTTADGTIVAGLPEYRAEPHGEVLISIIEATRLMLFQLYLTSFSFGLLSIYTSTEWGFVQRTR